RPASFRSRLVPASRCGRAVRVLAQGVSAAGHTIRETGGELPGDDSSGLHRTLPPGGVLRQNLVPDVVPGELEEHVLEVREHGAKVPNGQSVGGDEANDGGDEVVAPPLYRVRGALDANRPGSRNALQFTREARAIAGEHHAALGAVPADEVGGCAHLDETPALDD